jgi:hypothetical protein
VSHTPERQKKHSKAKQPKPLIKPQGRKDSPINSLTDLVEEPPQQQKPPQQKKPEKQAKPAA